MNWKRHFAELASLVAAAVACALVANALASPARKLAVVRAERVVPARVPPVGEAAREPAEPSPATAAPTPSLPPAAPAAKASGTTAARTIAPTPASRAASISPESEMRRRFPPHGKPWKEIPGDDVAWLHAKGALFLDARFEKIYAEGHVAGARSFPVWQAELLKPRAEQLVSEGRDGALPIVLYCSGGDCEDSHMLGEQLFGAGFTNLLVYKDGYPDWERRGGATRKGLEP